jgi:hypothetical protein
MKLFIINCIKFFGIMIIICVSLYACIDYLNSKKSNDYISSLNKKAIFVGDSHMQCGINDAVIANGINFSQDAESYYFTFQKLEKILALNKEIKTIYLGFSYHNLSSYYDDYIFGKENLEISSRYFFILPPAEKRKFMIYNSDNEILYFNKIIVKGILNIRDKKNNYSFFGGYQNNFYEVGSKKKSMDKRIKNQFFKNDTITRFSEINLSYLDKIMELCKRENKDLIVLNTPLDSYYKSKIPQEYVYKYNQIIESKKLKVIDFNAVAFKNNDFLKDGDHVSKKGAILISKMLNN